MEKVLVTGGCGYIGSHTIVELINQGYPLVILDNLCNSSIQVLDRIERICGHRPEFVKGSINDAQLLKHLFEEHQFSSVIHFAGLKAVGESVDQPLRYYQNNVQGSLTLFRAMSEHGCHRIVFSSSATVYGDPARVPVDESFPLSATNPYGQSKLMIENILRDMSNANNDWQISLLRYFNPVAAHPSGLIGEDPYGIPNNLLPFIAQVAIGKRQHLSIFGKDYPTPDGTGIRDYVHVVDLANAHLKALQKLSPGHSCQTYNIGTGSGYSVLEMVSAFEQASGKKVAYKFEARRHGDIASCYADVSLAKQKLNWHAKYGLEQMMLDHWRWQSQNPQGYES